MRARALGTVAAAQAAVALDAAFASAQVALSKAQLQAGDAASARATLERMVNLQQVLGGQVLLARVLLAAGDAAGAVKAAQRELAVDPWKSAEPVSRALREQMLREATEVEGTAMLAQGNASAAARLLLIAAAQGAPEARTMLGTLSRDTKARPSLEKLAKDKRLPKEQGTLLRTLLAEGGK